MRGLLEPCQTSGCSQYGFGYVSLFETKKV